ncbi:hypothetical protein C900_00673 [Fulvivirga imtechensis AK7]|uniref:Uncharacterized protein n=1 Tax=Fulvivirga imtechensis AK7 TaxID=1237149 RepID=L8JH41_9BACT|nr:hypothetical protein C900_00673 [Fulvivirga imtechensis AK7]
MLLSRFYSSTESLTAGTGAAAVRNTVKPAKEKTRPREVRTSLYSLVFFCSAA